MVDDEVLERDYDLWCDGPVLFIRNREAGGAPWALSSGWVGQLEASELELSESDTDPPPPSRRPVYDGPPLLDPER
jgi:hypothetical protein